VETREQLFKRALDYPVEVTRSLFDESLFDFLEYFWPTVSNDPFVYNWHIEYLCSEVLQPMAERVARREPNPHDIIVNIPPGTTKTITCSIVFPVWCWTRWHWMRFLTLGYSGALSLQAADHSRDLIKSEQFKELYPELRLDKDAKGNYRIIKYDSDGTVSLGGFRFSSSITGTVTGWHGHINIVDDPLNPHQAASDQELSNVTHFVDHTLPTRKTDKRVTAMLLIMQRLDERDPSGHLLAKDQEKAPILHICLPGDINDERYAEKVSPPELKERYVDGLLDPNRLDRKVLDGLEENLGQYGFAGQIGQCPTPPTGGMFQIDRFVMVEAMPEQHQIVKTVRYWDKAGTDAPKEQKGKGPAWTVGTKISKLKNGKFIVSDVVRFRHSAEVREQIMRETAVADGPGVDIWIEQEPGSGGKDSAEASVRNLAGYTVRLDRPTGNKAYRADPYSVQVNRWNVMLLKGDWNKEFKSEHGFFPFSRFKDQVDSASGAMSKLAAGKEAWILK